MGGLLNKAVDRETREGRSTKNLEGEAWLSPRLGVKMMKVMSLHNRSTKRDRV